MKRKLKPPLIMLTLLIAAVSVVIAALAMSGKPLPDGSNEQQRRIFIEELGYHCTEGETARNIVIPAEFSGVYQKYNDLQIQCGFDLSRFRGEEAVCYTYTLTDYPDPAGGFYRDIRLNLIVVDGKIVGGDICDTKLDGFMEGLKPKSS